MKECLSTWASPSAISSGRARSSRIGCPHGVAEVNAAAELVHEAVTAILAST
jgi:hypothetical protein